ncbi:helix-turn-helix domain-containing protein [Actinotignum sp. GS-2025c]|uniref:helix-turn-helix domain-containing protein n=1 Tax=Actinotignum sp. GS-2025c TaxID=3427276 RepID=UPI003F485180
MEGVVIQMAAEESAGIRPREETTREGILRLIMERGPISAAELAQLAILTPAGVRRHLVALEDAGAITECEKPGQREARGGGAPGPLLRGDRYRAERRGNLVSHHGECRP